MRQGSLFDLEAEPSLAPLAPRRTQLGHGAW
ncbi:hypothetical protein SAMN05216553_11530, partial [Lentzea fradiae]